MSGSSVVEMRPEGGELTWLSDTEARLIGIMPAEGKDHGGRYQECKALCRRLEDFWRSRGKNDVRCRPAAKRYRGRRVTGDKFSVSYWEVSSNIDPRWPA